jgi:hypothetical protein
LTRSRGAISTRQNLINPAKMAYRTNIRR